MPDPTRREFLRTTALAGAASVLPVAGAVAAPAEPAFRWVAEAKQPNSTRYEFVTLILDGGQHHGLCISIPPLGADGCRGFRVFSIFHDSESGRVLSTYRNTGTLRNGRLVFAHEKTEPRWIA